MTIFDATSGQWIAFIVSPYVLITLSLGTILSLTACYLYLRDGQK